MASAAATMVASPRLSIEALRGGLLWLMGFAGAFVFIEPSPYEIVGALAIVIFALTGLKLRAPLVPLILLLLLLNLGYATAMGTKEASVWWSPIPRPATAATE